VSFELLSELSVEKAANFYLRIVEEPKVINGEESRRKGVTPTGTQSGIYCRSCKKKADEEFTSLPAFSFIVISFLEIGYSKGMR
jgi:hypothetical protein